MASTMLAVARHPDMLDEWNECICLCTCSDHNYTSVSKDDSNTVATAIGIRIGPSVVSVVMAHYGISR